MLLGTELEETQAEVMREALSAGRSIFEVVNSPEWRTRLEKFDPIFEAREEARKKELQAMRASAERAYRQRQKEAAKARARYLERKARAKPVKALLWTAYLRWMAPNLDYLERRAQGAVLMANAYLNWVDATWH